MPGRENLEQTPARLQDFAELYARYAAVRAAANTPHGDKEVRELREQLAELEGNLQRQYRVPFSLQASEIRRSEDVDKAKAIRAGLGENIANLQGMSMRGISSGERSSSDDARILQENGISFACLYSTKKGAIIIKGGLGEVHNDIRQQFFRGGDPKEFRPDSSGILVTVGKKMFFFCDSPISSIWPNRTITGDYGTASIAVLETGDPSINDLQDSFRLEPKDKTSHATRLTTHMNRAYLLSAEGYPVLKIPFQTQAILDGNKRINLS